MKIVPTYALTSFLVVSTIASQEELRSVPGLQASESSAVYVKVILPVKAPAEGDHPSVESWIAQKLRKLGATEFSAVSGWVRLTDSSKDRTVIWDGILDGKHYGCPVDGQVSECAADGRVHVTFRGWAPGAPRIMGNSLPAEIGSRTIAVVDTGRVDGVNSYVALIIAPALQTKLGEQVSADQPANAPKSKPEGEGENKPEAAGGSQ